MKPSVKTTARRPKFDLTPISVDEALSNPALAGIESTLRQLAGLDDRPASVVETSGSGDFYPHDGYIEPAKHDSHTGDVPIVESHIGDSPIGDYMPLEPQKMTVNRPEVRTGSPSCELQGVHGEADSTTGLRTSKAPIRIIPTGNIPIGLSSASTVEPTPTCDIPIGIPICDVAVPADHAFGAESMPIGDTPTGLTDPAESGAHVPRVESVPTGNTPIGESQIDPTEPDYPTSLVGLIPIGYIPIGLTGPTESGAQVPFVGSVPIGNKPVGESQIDLTEPDDPTSLIGSIPIGDIPKDAQIRGPAEADAPFLSSGFMHIGDPLIGGLHLDGTKIAESPGTGELSNKRGAAEIGLPGDVPHLDARALPLAGVDAQPPRYRQKIRLASDVQDGHSNGEQLLYQALWRVGRQETLETKLVTIGYGGMHDVAKLDRSNCKKNILSLIEKLAVETVGKHSVQRNVGKTYRVYSYSAILRRRKQAGMLYIVRANGVRFVRPDGNLLTGYQVSLTQFQTNQNKSPIGYPPIGESIPPQSELPIGNIENPPIAPLGKIPVGPIGEAPRVYKKPKEETNNLTQQTSSTSVHEPTLGQLSQSLNEVLPFIDDQAVRFLWTECRTRVADCSVTEVIYFTKAKAAVLAGGKIQNPIGFLLAAVPKCFEGQSFLAFRRAQREQEDAEAKLRLQREEVQRQAEKDTKREIEVYTWAEETLNSMSQNERELLRQNVTREYLKRYPSARHMPDFESWIRRMMIREIVKKPGGFSK